MRILGIDYGARRIGIAISDESETIANAKLPLQREDDEELIKELSKLIKSEKIDKVVLGLPVSLTGQEEMQAQLVKKFGGKLSEGVDIAIDYEDERLTSSQARDMISENKQQKSIDSQSAQIILQTYLDTAKNKSNE